MKKLIKYVSILLIFIVIQFIVYMYMIFQEKLETGTNNPGTLLISLTVSVTLTKLISLLIWKKKKKVDQTSDN